jgi:hypothetical protein
MGFEPAIPAIKRLHTYALDCTVTRSGVREALPTGNVIKPTNRFPEYIICDKSVVGWKKTISE